MYDLIIDIIGHTWDTSQYSNTEQQYVYSICGVIIIIVLVVLVERLPPVMHIKAVNTPVRMRSCRRRLRYSEKYFIRYAPKRLRENIWFSITIILKHY